jgi:hypothetical protein
MRDKEYKPLSLVGAYPGYVSIDRWEAGALIVTSDMLLHGPVTRAGLLAEETFSMDVQSGKLKPLSDALNNPLQYFAAGLRDPDKSMRMAAVWGLRELDDQSAVPSLKQALTAEGDETVREEIRDLLKQLARAAELIGVCMSSNAETLQTKKIISEPIRAISLDGKTQAVDQAICVIPPDDKWGHQTWYRVDTSERRFRITSLKSSYDEVARLSASPNGKFLAAQFTGVSGTRLEIIDLAALMRNHEYRKIETIWGFRGSVSIQQWRDNDLHLTSDVFPDHIVSDKGEGDPVNLPLLSPETFVWRSETATIVPPSGALSDPIPYYCAGVAAAKTDGQRIALRGLSLMKDRAAIPCLESALANDTDAEMKAEIRKTIETILGK